VQAGGGLPLRPGDLQQGPADAGEDLVPGEQGDLLADAPVEVGGAPAELPHVDVPGDDLEQRLQLGEREALVEHVGESHPPGLGAPRRKVEEAAASHHFV
jgi:hypothetical protein